MHVKVQILTSALGEIRILDLLLTSPAL